MILNRLKEIEIEHDIKIILAVESGSRAWGFESADSDYDVRFVYMHKKDWYLHVKPKRDVIEYPIVDDFDFSGWDIKKTLELISRSNNTISEWLRSPIVYIRDNRSVDILREINNLYFSPVSSIYHYLSMAERNFDPIQKKDQIRLKKYFYVLRPTLACFWIMKYKEFPPIEFEKLLTLLDIENPVYLKIRDLLEIKKSLLEAGEIFSIGLLDSYISESLYAIRKSVEHMKKPKTSDNETLDKAFIDLVNLFDN
ncbi:MAG: nucleotidyltransferase domain-containing protein [Spirochaetales bacterium]|nr:nucleotidyltransferase domain-containing protein [Spirochaetales bacterium]